jgi:hypothetical protein
MSVYDIGQEIRNYGTFQTAAGAAFDPGTVRFSLATPGGTPVYIGSYVEGQAFGSVVREATGTYYADVRLTAGGYWRRGWEGSGTLNATTYDRIFVRYAETNT